MIYIITGYVGVVILAILLYYRYSEYRFKSVNENKTLIEQYEAKLNDLRQANDHILQESRVCSQKVQDVLQELNAIRRDKEAELKLRLSAEKQVEIAIQKTHDMEGRLEDWNDLQDSVMQDFLFAINKVGEDLYQKLEASYKENSLNLATAKPPTNSPHKNESSAQSEEVVNTSNGVKNLLTRSIKALEGAGLSHFLQKNIDSKNAALMLCELAFVKDQTLYFVDFKSLRYLDEYNVVKAKDQNFAKENLQKRLDKYFAYLANPKYNASILKALPVDKIKHTKIVNLFCLQGAKEMALLQEIGYQEKAAKLNLAAIDANSLNKIIL